MCKPAAHGHGTRRLWVSALALIAIGTPPSEATEIYRWVDDTGVVHFSDTRPRHETTIETVELRPLNPDSYDPADDPYSILNQAERLQAAWTERRSAKRSDEDRWREPATEKPVGPRRYAPYLYYPAVTGIAAPPRRFRPGAGDTRAQSAALDALNLTSQRPASINSGVHRDRVMRSEGLPTVQPANLP
jgi:hypothetical protein